MTRRRPEPAPGWDTSGTAPGRLPDKPTVRPTGVTSSHKVPGVGHHDHTEFVTEDGTLVTVARFRARTDPVSVTWWDAGGKRWEVRATGSVEWALDAAGFEVAAPATATPPEIHGDGTDSR